MKSIFDIVKETGDQLPPRNPARIMLQLAEEVGELAKEVNIEYGESGKTPDKDGIIGEAVDVILAAMDVIQSHYPNVSERTINTVAKLKCEKWKAGVEKNLKIKN